MAATIRITCVYGAPKGWQWAAHINQHARFPVAWVDGKETELHWDRVTEIPVSSEEPHKLQVFMRLIGLHWCPAEVEVQPIRDGESQSYEYRVEVNDRFVNRGQLTPIQ
ncbi:MAG TPA: hypothetical protein VGY58_06060 [Gemmataceae bacterium]|nr:hypothetical protein [Gemmataceae bacterium]